MTTLVGAGCRPKAKPCCARAASGWKQTHGEAAKVGGMGWPVPDRFPALVTQWTGISNFVDHDRGLAEPRARLYLWQRAPTTPAAGYNHAGVDIFLWPFGWHVMDHGSIDVRAAAVRRAAGKQ
jgi:hypothetical protein